MANKLYQNDETAITWLSSGGDNLLTLTSLGAGAGRQGAVHDFGATARAFKFAWRAWAIHATTPVVGEYLAVHKKTSDGTSPDNDDGTGDSAVSSVDKLANLPQFGSIVVDEAAAVLMVASGEIFLPQRYFMPVIWNYTADGLSSTALDHGFSLTPIPPELQ